MNYSLGNMLGGNNGSLNPDKLSLNLQFAADKTLTARKGPTPTFTRASTATFVGSDGLIQSAAVNAARFDHDPVTLASKGLLIEESRTNLLLQSQTFGTTWTAANLNTTGTPAYLNVATAPDGTTTADKIIGTVAVSTHQFRQSVTLVSGTVYSITCYFKAAEQQFASIAAFGVANGSADWVSLFNISSSPAAGTFNGFTSTSVTSSGNGWVRCTVVFTATASGSLEIRLGGASAASGINPHIYLGDGTSGIFAWGAQLEAGTFPTSYIPTTTASVVRSVDLCSITGSDFTLVYNESEHTLFAEVSAMSHANFGSYLSFDNGTVGEQSALAGFPSPNTTNCFVVDNSTTQASVSRSVTLNQNNKIAAAMKINSFQVTVNNVLGTQDTVGTMPTATIFKIGRAWNAATISGTYKQIKVFKKRLDNAKLQTLTTL
jgi:hypothetical protein